MANTFHETSNDVTRNSLPCSTSTSVLSQAGHQIDQAEVISDCSPQARQRTSAVTHSSSSSASGMFSESRTRVQQNDSDSGTTCRSAPTRTRTTSTWRPSAWVLTTPAIASHSDSSCIAEPHETFLHPRSAQVVLSAGLLPGAHFSSKRPKRHTSSATAQVRTNMPTMTKPTALRSRPPIQSQNGPCQPSCPANKPSSSMLPINSATATDSPVMVML